MLGLREERQKGHFGWVQVQVGWESKKAAVAGWDEENVKSQARDRGRRAEQAKQPNPRAKNRNSHEPTKKANIATTL